MRVGEKLAKRKRLNKAEKQKKKNMKWFNVCRFSLNSCSLFCCIYRSR